MFAPIETEFIVEATGVVFFSDVEERAVAGDLIVPGVAVASLIIGLRTFDSHPRTAAVMRAVGLLPVALTEVVFFWFPPMWAVSPMGSYLIYRVFAQAGRLTRTTPAPA